MVGDEMTLFRQQEDGKFDVLEKTAFSDLERKLEDWIEASPGILFDGEPLAVISRQPRSSHGKYLDLLAVDRRGTTVVVELKRGEAPREVVAQALEYAAWVESLTFDQLDEIARNYATQRGIEAHGIRDLYGRVFGDGDADDSPVDATVVTFNSRQTIVIVAEEFSPEVEQTARYLRARLGADIHAVRFSVHRAGGEIVLETSSVVGREPVKAVQAPKDEGGNDDDVRAYVKTDFMKSIVGAFDQWAWAFGDPGFSIEHPGWNRRIRYRGEELIYFYHAKNWLSLAFKQPTEGELKCAKAGLSHPEHIREHAEHFWCRLYEPSDIDLIKSMLDLRVASAKVGQRGEPGP